MVEVLLLLLLLLLMIDGCVGRGTHTVLHATQHGRWSNQSSTSSRPTPPAVLLYGGRHAAKDSQKQLHYSVLLEAKA